MADGEIAGARQSAYFGGQVAELDIAGEGRAKLVEAAIRGGESN